MPSVPDFSKEFLLFTDASSDAVGAMLGQVQDGALHPIGYFSKKISRTERNWPTIELEALALVNGLENFESITRHATVRCFTDSMACKTILLHSKQPSHRRAKLASRLAQFDNVTIDYIKGARNRAADFLSRLEVSESESDDVDLDMNGMGKVDTERIKMKGIKVDKPIRTKVRKIVEKVSEEHNNLVTVLDGEPHPAEEEEYEPPTDPTILDNDRNALDTFQQMLKSKYTAQQIRMELLADSYFGPILQYLETGKFDIDMTSQLRKLFQVDAKKFTTKEGLLWLATTEPPN
ncbi:hypothetical protein EB796_000067 [Bugula neritina]|uniref:Reverse transcriptase RNase H-like domain-containing protein n=1 Tax=Bugula neritina TaxID=10212 RepID=A0A7J7KU20_BUGNE|nr:hypothetical protein EB796_000067 [Bugula neritina]